jgi:hypothetical protein
LAGLFWEFRISVRLPLKGNVDMLYVNEAPAWKGKLLLTHSTSTDSISPKVKNLTLPPTSLTITESWYVKFTVTPPLKFALLDLPIT